jgi:hypothetical protein
VTVTPGIDDVLGRMTTLLDRLDAQASPRRFFLGTYSRTTRAVGEAVTAGRFEDPDWVDRWDVAFADLYLRALAADDDDPSTVPRPWRLAFAAPPGLHPLQHVLLGINAHVNYDLPQALLAVIPDDDVARPTVMARRRRDHERIDAVLASRVAAEDGELQAAELDAARRSAAAVRGRTVLDRLLQPVNRAASKRFLREARQKVWLNTEQLQQARQQGDDVYRRRLAELELLSAARIADLLAPGNVLLKLAVGGFGVLLPPP